MKFKHLPRSANVHRVASKLLVTFSMWDCKHSPRRRETLGKMRSVPHSPAIRIVALFDALLPMPPGETKVDRYGIRNCSCVPTILEQMNGARRKVDRFASAKCCLSPRNVQIRCPRVNREHSIAELLHQSQLRTLAEIRGSRRWEHLQNLYADRIDARATVDG